MSDHEITAVVIGLELLPNGAYRGRVPTCAAVPGEDPPHNAREEALDEMRAALAKTRDREAPQGPKRELGAARSDPPMEKCRSCRAPVVWLKKPDGTGRMIVDWSPEAARRHKVDEPWEKGRKDLVSHYATCPQAAKWRKKK